MHRFYKCGRSPALAIQGADWPVASEGPSLTRSLPVWIAACIPWTKDPLWPSQGCAAPLFRACCSTHIRALQSPEQSALKAGPVGRDCSCLRGRRVPKPARTLGNWSTSDHRGGAELAHQLLVVSWPLPLLVCGRGLGVYFAPRILARSAVVP